MRALDGLRLRYVLVVIPHLRILWVGDMFFETRQERKIPSSA